MSIIAGCSGPFTASLASQGLNCYENRQPDNLWNGTR